MFIAIAVVAAIILCLSLCLSSRRASPRMDRAERIGLDSYERKARCEGAFPFDYLTR
jgi:hypothetical protein